MSTKKNKDKRDYILRLENTVFSKDEWIKGLEKDIQKLQGQETELKRLNEGWTTAANDGASWKNQLYILQAKCNRLEVLIHMYLEGKLP